MAREEGEVNVVQWAGYAQLTDEFTAATGCAVNTKDGASSDDMISLIQTGAYDGVSASGNASVRLMATGEVAPINTDFIPNYADVQEGIKNQDYNSLDGQPYGVPHGRGPNYLMFRNDIVPEDTNSWSVIWEDDGLQEYAGKISIYDDSIFIADAAVYLKATQPDLGIDNPYQLNEEQFNAAVDLLKKQAPAGLNYWAGGRRCKADRRVHERRQRRRDDVAVPVRPADGAPIRPCRSRRSSRRRARRAGRTRGCCTRRPRTRTACISG